MSFEEQETEAGAGAGGRGGNGALMSMLAFFSLSVTFILLILVLNPGFLEILARGDIDALLSDRVNLFFLAILAILVFSLATLIKTLGIAEAIPLSKIRSIKLPSRGERRKSGGGESEEEREASSQEETLEIEGMEAKAKGENAESGEEAVAEAEAAMEKPAAAVEASESKTQGEGGREEAGEVQRPIGIDAEAIERDIDRKIAEAIERIKTELAQDTSKLANHISSIMNDLKELSERVNSIESNIESLIIDVKTAVSELSNPFNYLRKFTEENELKDMGVDLSKYAAAAQAMQQGAAGQGGGNSVSTAATGSEHSNSTEENSHNPASGSGEAGSGNGNGAAATQQTQVANPGSGEGVQMPGVQGSTPGSVDLGSELKNILSSNLSVSQVMKLIVLFGELMNSIDRTKVLDIIQLGFTLNIIPNESKDIVASIIRLLEETKAPPKTLALILYKLAKSLGVTDQEADFLAIAYSGGDEMWQIRQ